MEGTNEILEENDGITAKDFDPSAYPKNVTRAMQFYFKEALREECGCLLRQTFISEKLKLLQLYHNFAIGLIILSSRFHNSLNI